MVDGFCVYCVPDWHAALAAIRARGLPVVSAEEQPDGGPETMYAGIDDRLEPAPHGVRAAAG